MGGGGAQRPLPPPRACLRIQKDGCAQRTGAHARPKPTSDLIYDKRTYRTASGLTAKNASKSECGALLTSVVFIFNFFDIFIESLIIL